MPQREIPVACVQARAHDRARFADAWPRLLALADRAAADGAKLVVLPEGSVPAYVLGDEPVDQTLLERASADVAHVARAHGITIVYGGAKLAHGRTFNAAIAVGPDGEIGFAAKQFLWHFDRRWFAPGATLEPIDTPAGRLGLLVCADGRIPSIAATLAQRGAELLVMPTAWVTSGRDPAALENVQADLMINVRARENGVPFVAANKCGVELESVAYCGKSAIVDADGAFIARGGERTEEIVAGAIFAGAGERREVAPLEAPSKMEAPRARARIAFTLARDPRDVARLAALATQADADLLFAFGAPETSAIPIVALADGDAERVLTCDGLRFGIVSSATFRTPRGLVPARLAGVDVFVCLADGDAAWHLPFARTRAAELRAYVIVFDRAGGRAFAVDPDGAVVAGTFDDFRLAAFAYDAARTQATTVAPATDVLDALRIAEAIRTAAVVAA